MSEKSKDSFVEKPSTPAFNPGEKPLDSEPKFKPPFKPEELTPSFGDPSRVLSESDREALAANQRVIDDGRTAEETARKAREKELRALNEQAKSRKAMDLSKIERKPTIYPKTPRPSVKP